MRRENRVLDVGCRYEDVPRGTTSTYGSRSMRPVRTSSNEFGLLAEEARFDADHGEHHAGRWSMEGSGYLHCFDCCPPHPLSQTQIDAIAAIFATATRTTPDSKVHPPSKPKRPTQAQQIAALQAENAELRATVGRSSSRAARRAGWPAATSPTAAAPRAAPGRATPRAGRCRTPAACGGPRPGRSRPSPRRGAAPAPAPARSLAADATRGSRRRRDAPSRHAHLGRSDTGHDRPNGARRIGSPSDLRHR